MRREIAAQYQARRQAEPWYLHSLPAVSAAHNNLQSAVNAPSALAARHATSFEAPLPAPGVDSDGKVNTVFFEHLRTPDIGIFTAVQKARYPPIDNGVVPARTPAQDANTGSSSFPDPPLSGGGTQPRPNVDPSFRSLLAHLNARPTVNPIPNFLQPDPRHVTNFRRGLLTTFLGWLATESEPQFTKIDAVCFYTVDYGDPTSKAGFQMGVLREAIKFEVSAPTKSSDSGTTRMGSMQGQYEEQASNQTEKWTVFVLVEQPHPGPPADTTRPQRVQMGSANSNTNFIHPFENLNLQQSSPSAPTRLETPWHLVAFPTRCISSMNSGVDTQQVPSSSVQSSFNPNPTGQTAQHTRARSAPFPSNDPSPHAPSSYTQSYMHQFPQPPTALPAAMARPRGNNPHSSGPHRVTPRNPSTRARQAPPPLPTVSRSAEQQQQQQQQQHRRHQPTSAPYPIPPSSRPQTKEWVVRNARVNTGGRIPLMEGGWIQEQFWREWMEGCRIGEVGVAWWELDGVVMWTPEYGWGSIRMRRIALIVDAMTDEMIKPVYKHPSSVSP